MPRKVMKMRVDSISSAVVNELHRHSYRKGQMSRGIVGVSNPSLPSKQSPLADSQFVRPGLSPPRRGKKNREKTDRGCPTATVLPTRHRKEKSCQNRRNCKKSRHVSLRAYSCRQVGAMSIFIELPQGNRPAATQFCRVVSNFQISGRTMIPSIAAPFLS